MANQSTQNDLRSDQRSLAAVARSWGSIGAGRGDEFKENRAGKFESNLSMVSIVDFYPDEV